MEKALRDSALAGDLAQPWGLDTPVGEEGNASRAARSEARGHRPCSDP